MNVLLFVVALVLGIALINAVIWIPILRFMRKRSRSVIEALRAEVAQSGEHVLRGPESGLYRGATANYSRVGNNCILMLTERRLVICALAGKRIEVPTARIAGVREAKTFLGRRRGGAMHVVVQLDDNETEIGFVATDHQGWLSELRALKS